MPTAGRDLVFVSYSHASPKWRDRLLVLLKPFVRQGQVQVWADPYIQTGDLWRREIDHALTRTRVGVVLLTPALLASDFITDVEIPHLLRGARAGELTLIVVPIGRHVEGSTQFADGDLSDYQWAWDPGDPLDELEDAPRKHAMVTVTQVIVRAATPSSQSLPLVRPFAPARLTKTRRARSAHLGDVYGVPTLPPHYIPRSDVHEAAKRAVLGQSSVIGVSSSVSHVGLYGQGGLGKTVVAQGLASDEDVRRAFPEGVYWVTVGQQPRIEALQAELAAYFGARPDVESVPAGVQLLRQRLAGRKCLVILDDVWDVPSAKAFDALDVQSRILITTRDSSVLTALGAHDVRLDVLTPPMALELIAHWAGLDPSRLPAQATELARAVGYLPLALALGGAQIKDGRQWPELLAAVQEGKLAFLDHPYGSVFASIEASVKVLGEGEAALYIELAVFPEDIEIPLVMIERLWHASSGIDARDTRTLVSRLAARSLLTVRRAPASASPRGTATPSSKQTDVEVVVLHDLQHDYTRLVVENLPTLHQQLVNAIRSTLQDAPEGDVSHDSADQWAALPDVPAYPWLYLAYHLSRAGYQREVEQLLTSQEWLFAKLTRVSLVALLDDFRQSQGDGGLRSISDALRLSSHVLTKDSTALPGQLAGRLLDSPDARVQRLIRHPPRALHGPFFRPDTRCLVAPGGPLRQTFVGHTDKVTAVVVLPDGQRALSGSEDRTLKLWDLASGEALRTLEGHTGSVTAVAGLPDGQRVLSSSEDGTLKLWDLASGTMLRTFEGHIPDSLFTLPEIFEPHTGATALTALPDGQRALSGHWNGSLKLWDLTSGSVRQTVRGRTGWVTVVPRLAGVQCVLLSVWRATRKLWHVALRVKGKKLEGHTGRVDDMAVLPGGRLALSGSWDATSKMWDIASGTVLQTLEGHSDNVNVVSLLPDGRRALSGSWDGTLKLWDLASGTMLKSFDVHMDRALAAAALPDGQRALVAKGRRLELWSLTSGAVIQRLEGHMDSISAVTVLADGQRALSASVDRTLKLWDLISGEVLQTPEGHPSSIQAVAVLPDGQQALSGGVGGLTLWNLTSGSVLDRFDEGEIRAVAALSDGRRALRLGWDGTLRLLDLASKAVLRTFEGHTSKITAMAVLPDEQHVLSGSSGPTLKLWDLASGVVLRTFEGHTGEVKSIAVLPGGQQALCYGFGQTWKVLDIASGAVLKSFEAKGASAVALLPDGQRALFGGSYGTLKLWDLASGAVVQTFEGHTDVVTAVTLLPDGERVLSGSHDASVRLWDLASGALVATFQSDARINTLTLLRDEARVVVGDDRGKPYVLRLMFQIVGAALRQS